MKNAKIKNRQKLSMLVVTMVLVLLMTLIAGIFTGCGKNAGGGLDGTESSGANADGSAGGGKGRFIESKVALPEEINSILQGRMQIIASMWQKAVMEAETGRQHR